MQTSKNSLQKALIDTDFINHLIETKIDTEELLYRVKTIFDELKLAVIVHPLVLKEEILCAHKRMSRFLSERIIDKVNFEDIHQNDDDKIAYYEIVIEDLYHYIHGESIDTGGESIFTYWRSKKSLGEMHSLASCIVAGWGMFLSDDNDSKDLSLYIKNKYQQIIAVYDRKELINKHLNEGKTHFIRKERKQLIH